MRRIIVQAQKKTGMILKGLIGLLLLAGLVSLVVSPERAAESAVEPGSLVETAETDSAALMSAVLAAAPHTELLPASSANLGPGSDTGTGAVQVQAQADDRACRLCHADTEAVITFPSGESLPARVDGDSLAGSAHGLHLETPLACTDCHAPADYQFPHEPVEAADIRSYELERASTCERCHQQPHRPSHPGLESDNPVVCTDCHGSHEVFPAAEMRGEAALTACVDCHVSRDIELQEPASLARVVENGLFSSEVGNDDYCLACHAVPDQFMVFENGDRVSLTVRADEFHDSVHGADNSWQALNCADCHMDQNYPHEAKTAESAREYRLEMYPACSRCHEPKYESTLDDVHGAALAEGNENAAVCTDCHGAHDIPVPNEPRSRISHTCEQCHSTIFDDYATSVHGEALLEDSNEDVPTCIDCHGVHNLSDPKTALFRVQSPELCGSCHANEELMTEYDISTDVFETYLADFHGTTVTLFEHDSPDVATNKAVCFDCHGIHDIHRPDDPKNGINLNLLETCQQCHPDATENFSAAWTSHYVPSWEHNTLVFLINWFYRLIIPGTVGGLSLLVLTDVYRRVRTRVKK